MQDLKQQLEDLSFASLHPKRYAEIDQMVSARRPSASPTFRVS
jgi:GTP pyrophosphokinase